MKVHIDNTTLDVDEFKKELRKIAKKNNERLDIIETVTKRINNRRKSLRDRRG